MFRGVEINELSSRQAMGLSESFENDNQEQAHKHKAQLRTLSTLEISFIAIFGSGKCSMVPMV